MKRELNVIIGGVALWCAGFITAPLITSEETREFLFRLYSVVCHQFNSRSFHLMGEPFAVCIRCSAIYVGFLLTLIALRSSGFLRRAEYNTLVLLAVTSLPMAIDGLLSLFGLYQATEVSRLITGTLFGIGMALLLHHPLEATVHTIFFKKTSTP